MHKISGYGAILNGSRAKSAGHPITIYVAESRRRSNGGGNKGLRRLPALRKAGRYRQSNLSCRCAPTPKHSNPRNKSRRELIVPGDDSGFSGNPRTPGRNPCQKREHQIQRKSDWTKADSELVAD